MKHISIPPVAVGVAAAVGKGEPGAVPVGVGNRGAGEMTGAEVLKLAGSTTGATSASAAVGVRVGVGVGAALG